MIEVPMICVDNGYDLLHQSKFEHSNKVADDIVVIND